MTQFLAEVSKGSPNGFLTLWDRESKQTRYFDLASSTLDEIKHHVDQLVHSGKDVYYGVCSRIFDLGPSKRGALDDLHALTMIWADVDFAAEGHNSGKKYPENKDKALELLTSSELPAPSVVIHTGGGLHVYWLLTEPIIFDSPSQQALASQLVTGFQRRLRSHFQQEGYEIDSTADLPRVLRLPGTQNFKVPTNPRPVYIIEDQTTWARYPLADIQLASQITTTDQLKNPLALGYKEFEGNAYIAMQHCRFLQYFEREAETLTEPDWHAGINNLALTVNGPELIHRLSASYPNYSVAETEEKIRRAQEGAMPHTCQFIQTELGFRDCPQNGCPVKSPVGWSNSRLGQSLDRLYCFMGDSDSKLENLFEQGFVDHLAIVKAKVPSEYERLILRFMERFKKSRFSRRQFDRLVNPVVNKMNAQQQEVVLEQELDQLTEILGFKPKLPLGYLYQAGQLSQVSVRTLTPFISSPVFITALFDSRFQLVQLTYRFGKDWRRVIVAKEQIVTAHELPQLSAQGLPFNSNNARTWIDFLSAFLALNQDSIPSYQSTTHYGWQDENHFLPGNSDLLFIPKGRFTPEDFGKWCKGTLEEWAHQVAPILNTPIAYLILCASFAAPLLEVLRIRTFILHVYGPSQGGKTAALVAAASVWNLPEKFMVNFNSTKVALERRLALYKNLPIIIDERQAAGTNQAFLDSLVYLIGEGQGRSRGTRSGGLEEAGNWRTIAITSGEDPLSDAGSRQGVKTRALELYAEKVFDNLDIAKSMHSLPQTAFGTTGPYFVEWVCENKPVVETSYKAIHEKLRQRFELFSGSDYEYFAILLLTDLVLKHLFYSETLPTDFTVWDLPEFIVPIIEQRQQSLCQNDGERVLEFIKAEVGANPTKFAIISGEGDERRLIRNADGHQEYGWILNDTDLLLNPNVLRDFALRGNFHLDRFKKDAATRGWLRTGTDRGSVSYTIPSRKKRCDSMQRMFYFPNFFEVEREVLGTRPVPVGADDTELFW